MLEYAIRGSRSSHTSYTHVHHRIHRYAFASWNAAETGKSLPAWQLSAHVRTGPAQWLAEGVATFGPLHVVLDHRRSEDVPWMVACWIGAAYWFTASTSFANPAITIARSLSNAFSGIRPADVPAFIGAQFVGAFAAPISHAPSTTGPI